MRYNIEEEGRDETLKHAIANIYYYLEIHDEEKELMFKYPLILSKDRWSNISIMETDEIRKEVERILRYKLHLNSLTLMDFEAKFNMFQMNYYLECVVKLTHEEYLNCLYDRLYDIIPLVDLYNTRREICLEGVAQKYGIGFYKLLTPFKEPEDSDELWDYRRY